jgi:phosphatidylglycerophosphate synthase
MASNVNPANAVTASRFLTLPPFVWAIDRGYYQWAGALIIVCGLLDLADGAVARLFDCITPFGSVFDALADAVCYGFFLVVLVGYGWVPWLPVALILALGVANTALRTVYVRRAGRTVNYRSFAMERCVAYAAYLGGFGVAGFEVDYFYWSFTAIMAVTMIHDAKRMAIDPIELDDDDGPAAAAARTAT